MNTNTQLNGRFAITLKASTACIMLATAALMLYDSRQEIHAIPEYFKFTEHDFNVWVILLISLSFLKLYLLLYPNCPRCRVVGDLLLQASGFIFILIGSAFIANYPPFNLLMVFYPMWGVGTMIATRKMGRDNRNSLYALKGKKNENSK